MRDGSKNIVDTDRYKYIRTATEIGGKIVHSKDNGDAVAVALRGKNSDELVDILKENGMLDDRYKELYKTAKPGRFRMTVGQAIRYKWLRHDRIEVDGVPLAAAPEKPPKERKPVPPSPGSKNAIAAEEAKKAAEAEKASEGEPVEQVFDPST